MTKIFRKIDRVLIDIQQSFAEGSFRVDHVVTFKFNMKELQFI